MDCRKGLLFVAWLLVPLSGCTLRPSSEVRQDASEPPPEEVMKKPETLVAFSDYRAAAVFAPETPPQARAAFREEALAGYRRAIEINPKHVPAYLALARLQQASGDMAEAMETYKKALEVTTRDANVWYELGMCQKRQKQFGEAADSLRKACELRPDDKKCRETMGYMLAFAGRFEEALETLTGVIGEARANFCVGRALQVMNRTEEARQYVADALRRDPDLPGAREVLASLESQPPADAAPTPDAPPAPKIKTAPAPTPATPVAVESAPRPIRLPPRPVLGLSAGTD